MNFLGGDVMATALDFAKVFIKKKLDTNPDTFDGNMKIQKLLVFANLISLAENGAPLFSDPIYAFTNGCVVEDVRLRYRNDYYGLKHESDLFEPKFTQEHNNVIDLTVRIFGDVPAKELSELNHSFEFWKRAWKRSGDITGFKNKERSLVSTDEMLAEIDRIKLVVETAKRNFLEENLIEKSHKEVINGITFYYSSDLEMTDDVLEYLEGFSKNADDSVYTMYMDDGNLVIY